jgi:hypothetical protein
MSSDQLSFSITFVIVGIVLVLFNETISSYMTEQWLKTGEWFLPLKVREHPAFGTYKNLVYWIYRLTFYAGAVLCVGVIVFLFSKTG